MQIQGLSKVKMSTDIAGISFPPLAYLRRFAHGFGQLLGSLGQQTRRHIAFGHVGVHHKHRHDRNVVLLSFHKLQMLPLLCSQAEDKTKDLSSSMQPCGKMTTAPPSVHPHTFLDTLETKTQNKKKRVCFCIVTSFRNNPKSPPMRSH